MDAQKHYQIFIVVLGTIMNSVTIAMMLMLAENCTTIKLVDAVNTYD